MRETTVIAPPRKEAMDGKRSKYWVAYRKCVQLKSGRTYATRTEVEVTDCTDRADAMEAARLAVCDGAVYEGWD